MKAKERIQSGGRFLTFTLYLLGLILVFEWIRPLNAIAEFEHVYLFIVYAIFCFGLTYIKIPTWLSFLLRTIGLVLIIHYVFLPSPIFSEYWYQTVQIEWHSNLVALLERNWYQFTDLFQTLLFLLIIALVSYLLYFWLITMKRVFIFIIITIIFVTIMDTFTPYQADQAIIRLVMISLLMLMINNYLKRIEQKQLAFDLVRWFQRVLIPLVLTMITIGVLSYFAPKPEPVWPDPVPFITSTAEGISFGNRGETRTVGYGEDDSQLGGSFEMDDTPLFHAETSLDHYWRIESKDYYTGHGWERQEALNFQPYSEGSLPLFTPNSEQPLREATVQYLEEINFNKLVYPYGLYEIAHSDNEDFVFDQETGQIEPENMGQSLQTAPIEMSYIYPDFSTDQIRQSDGAISHEIAETYLQLPDQLPDRVIGLAEEIVADQSTRYDQAAAIESYFDQGDFTYQTTDIPVPDETEDYVDQFLFETQVGYCDNFSTSMVVMLRAVGIPARWVKGFTSGEQIEDLSTDDEELYRYEITNGNAHSWVEAYFPEFGWVPFEPTIGFSGNDMLYEESDDSFEDLEDESEDQDLDEEDMTEDDDQEADSSETDEMEQEEDESRSFLQELTLWPWLLGLIVILVIVALLRWKVLLQKIIFWHWSRFDQEIEFEKAYQTLFVLLRIHKLKRSSTQTLHDFAKAADHLLEVDLMTKLTDEYAQLVYRKGYQLENKELLYNQYQELIKRILA
ncbi:transglutaminase-like domain-containing protein [Amphibacillus sp. Q70]|uniref:transglutaminase-like domain-containing protein n=1 Tax=Amphibacillus sp. Q70 TaxID=3453416 RepID=UPI003F875ECF